MSDGQHRGPRSIWLTLEGRLLIGIGVIAAIAAIWGLISLAQEAMKPPQPKDPPAKTKPNTPRPQPQPPLPNPDITP